MRKLTQEELEHYVVKFGDRQLMFDAKPEAGGLFVIENGKVPVGAAGGARSWRSREWRWGQCARGRGPLDADSHGRASP